MKFPEMNDYVRDDVILKLAGPKPSRAAVHTATLQLDHVLETIAAVAKDSEPCVTWYSPGVGDGVTPSAAERAHQAVQALAGYKWPEHLTIRNAGGHDHGMCDPDIDCGPDDAPTTVTTADYLNMLSNAADYGFRHLYPMVDYPRTLAAEVFDAEARELGGRLLYAVYHEEGDGTPDRCQESEGPTPPEDDPAVFQPRLEDKLAILAAVIDAQQPLGTDLANFKRRLQTILEA